MNHSDSIFEMYDFDKIDAHVHLNSPDQTLSEIATESSWRLVTINTEVPFFPYPGEQKEIALRANSTDFLTTFTTDKWGEKGWQDEAIRQIEQGLNDGAAGVKIWKNIGMELKNKAGEFVMANDPSFDPIYDYLSKHEVPLLAHLGEPKNCWLSLDEMTVSSDRDYFSSHPQYHMYHHKAMPSYEDQLASRDHILEKFPKLRFIGAHLASIEWSVDELSKWLKRFPAAAVDLAERVCHLQHQASEDSKKVAQFVEKYQDRIIYGSDQIDDGTVSKEKLAQTIHGKWKSEFRFFAGSAIQTAHNVEQPFRGLGLAERILKKIFCENAIRYYPKIQI